MVTALVIHGHFYQPPRENPWTGEVEREPGAEPFHDWNERIYHECYRSNAYARVFDDHGRIEKLVNNYRHLSFNFGPTLLSWMERHHSMTYARILEADRLSIKLRGGHGNAIAQAYNHAILPLCNERDRITQVRWGIADFRYRFQREPESMWLPETACNDATLGTLIDEGMKYVILSPYQAERVRKIGEETWHNAKDAAIDTGVPYRYFHRDGSKRSIAIFFYDGIRSRAIAFEGALTSSRAMIERFAQARGGAGRLVSAATDGESYGHHSKWGDRCLAHAMEVEAAKKGFWITNYGEFLEKNPPTSEVEIQHGPDGFGSAWSCAHGVGRWFRSCGCHTGGVDGWTQAWRGPLRKALDIVRDSAVAQLETIGGELFKDVWAARDAYVDVVLDPRRNAQAFLDRHTKKKLDEHERVRALTLLEMQKNAQLMYTSCGWFFSDISGIESVQILKYAARVLDLAQELEVSSPKDAMLEMLAEAKSNKKELGSGADIFRKQVETTRVTPKRVSAHITMTGLVDDSREAGEIGNYSYLCKNFQRREDGRITLLTGLVMLQERSTGRLIECGVCALHFGGVDFYCVVRLNPGQDRFLTSAKRLWQSFPSASLPTMLRLAQSEFGPDEYGLEHVLPGGRERISQIVFGDLIQRFSEDYRNLFEENRRTLEMLQSAGFELPKELRAAAEFTLGREFEDEIRSQHQSQDPSAYRKALEIAHEVAERGYQIDRTVSSQIFGDMINARVLVAVTQPNAENVDSAVSLIQLTKKLGVAIDLDPAQEAVYEALTGITGGKAPKTELQPLATLLRIAVV